MKNDMINGAEDFNMMLAEDAAEMALDGIEAMDDPLVYSFGMGDFYHLQSDIHRAAVVAAHHAGLVLDRRVAI